MEYAGAIILAAGRGTRCYPLTLTRPKPLLPVLGEPIIKHNLRALSNVGANKVVIVIGYMGDKIKEVLGDSCCGIDIEYVKQENISGTGDAVLSTKDLVGDKFLVINGDDIYSPEDLKTLKEMCPAMLVKEVADVSGFGAVITKAGKLVGIKEKESSGKGIANTGAYCINNEIFSELESISPSIRGELELTDAIVRLASKFKINIVKANMWIPVSYPWDLLNANLELLNNRVANEKDNIIIEKNVVIKPGTYIEGPAYIGENSVIGPNAYIRPGTVIGKNCKIGFSVEVKNSLVMDGTKIPHLSYVGDSIIGENCNLGAGTKIANLRHDEREIIVDANGSRIITGRRKLGVVMGDGVKVGVNVSINPGTVIGPNTKILPGSVVKGHIPSNSVYPEKR